MKRPAANPHRYPLPIASANTERNRGLWFDALQSQRRVRIAANELALAGRENMELQLTIRRNGFVAAGAFAVDVRNNRSIARIGLCGGSEHEGGGSKNSSGKKPSRHCPEDFQVLN